MAQTLEAIVILLIVWQLMTRFKSNVQISPNAKSEFQEAIDDAKERLPNTGLFALFKAKSNSPKTVDKPEIQIEQTIVPVKEEKAEDPE